MLIMGFGRMIIRPYMGFGNLPAPLSLSSRSLIAAYRSVGARSALTPEFKGVIPVSWVLRYNRG